MNVAIIDYGAGNVPSVERALQRLGANCRLAISPQSIANADALLLPGVGHFSALIRALDERALRAPLVDAVSRGVPFLGICLGLQSVFDASDEAPELTGLRLIQGAVRRLPEVVKLPHMGWNQLRRHGDSRLLEGIASEAYFYFAHSYAVASPPPDVTSFASCTHGLEFVALLERDNILGVQFHPEKSGESGARVLRNFLRLGS